MLRIVTELQNHADGRGASLEAGIKLGDSFGNAVSAHRLNRISRLPNDHVSFPQHAKEESILERCILDQIAGQAFDLCRGPLSDSYGARQIDMTGLLYAAIKRLDAVAGEFEGQCL